MNNNNEESHKFLYFDYFTYRNQSYFGQMNGADTQTF